jgi:hypothetical protein
MNTELFTRDGTPLESLSGGRVATKKNSTVYVRPRRCWRCGGQGGAEKWRLTGWTCYKCGGKGTDGTESLTLYTADKLAKLNAAKEKADAKREAARAAKQAAEEAKAAAGREERIRSLISLAENFDPEGELYVALVAELEIAADDFLADMKKRLEDGKSLTDRQDDAARRAIRRKRHRRELAEKQAAGARHIGEVGDRVEISGEVLVSIFLGQGFAYNRNRELVKIMTDDGAIVIWITETGAPIRGTRVTGKATVKEHSERDGVPQTVITRPRFEFSRA